MQYGSSDSRDPNHLHTWALLFFKTFKWVFAILSCQGLKIFWLCWLFFCGSKATIKLYPPLLLSHVKSASFWVASSIFCGALHHLENTCRAVQLWRVIADEWLAHWWLLTAGCCWRPCPKFTWRCLRWWWIVIEIKSGPFDYVTVSWHH